MNSLVQQLALYATYHRNQRNVITHCLGIPMIILALDILLARPVLGSVVLPITPALLLTVLFCVYYLKSHLPLGLVISAWLLVFVAIGHAISGMSDTTWLASGILLLVVGWVLQFIGHYFEGRKPAFFDDIRGLLIGPGFIALEILAGLGLMRELSQRVRSCEKQIAAN